LFLSGGEDPRHLPVLIEVGAPYIAFSYWHMRRNKRAALSALRQAQNAGAEVLIHPNTGGVINQFDSKPRSEILNKLDTYVRDYVEFLNSAELGNPLICAELDVESLVGLDKVSLWREWFLAADIRPIITYHDNDEYRAAGGPSAFIAYCVEHGYDYVGLYKAENFYRDNIAAFGPQLMDSKVRLHLWGEPDERFPHASSSTTDWLNGSRFGTTHVFEPGSGTVKIHDLNVKSRVRKGLEQYCGEKNIPYQKFLDDDPAVVDLYHAHVWAEYARHLKEKVWDNYWLTEEESSALIEKQREAAGLARVLSSSESRVPATQLKEDPRLNMSRACNSCFIRDKCPEFRKNETCVFPGPPLIETPQDLINLLLQVVSVQANRALTASMIENLAGGYPDEAVTKEVVAFGNLMKVVKELQAKAKLTITAEGEGPASGLLEKIFKKNGD
jgi:hypothetical protein